MNNPISSLPRPLLSTDTGFPASTSRRPIQAFTLIELLTVIAIIGILAAIIIPVVGKVRKTALKAQSMSNVRSCAQAALLYASDNKDILPNTEDTLGADIVRRDTLEQYLPFKSEVWYDPVVAKVLGRDNYGYDSTDYLWRGRIRCNQVLLRKDGEFPGYKERGTKRLRIQISTVVRPSEAMLFAGLGSGRRGGYHDGYSPLAFVDGSAKMVKAGAPADTTSVIVNEYQNYGIPGQPAGLRGFDW
ncbi:MAG: prepilin-type N-terminal cleavage/methylation domain-containing protein [Opitutaceae bacterium]|jgi:prepilin-type N-terminal cleavage/methylation domain-containing protein|nr:prepilin-type N-terminal cleavage/methylation domain-containing protein [Opitutaceae bacterium]